MHFRRPRIVHQYPEYAAPSTVVQTQMLDLLLGDGSISADYLVIPTPNYDATCLVEQNINGNKQVFVGLNVVNLGGMVDLTFVIEFQELDNPNFWYPSKEPTCDGLAGVEQPLRTAGIAGHEWVIAAAGNFYVATRVEHPHFKKFRVRFRGAAGGPGAATDVRVYWGTDGSIAEVADQ